MAKREALIFSFLLVFVLSSVAASAVADVAYVYRKSFNVDQNVIDAFQDAGLSVEMIKETQLPINFDNYGMIYVGDEIFTRAHMIPVNDHPSIVANYYHMTLWGLTDEEGASQLASSQPLSVVKNNQMIQVYTQATEGIGGPAISYYFLDMTNRAPALETIALTQETSSGEDFGDVISYADVGDQMLNGEIQSAELCFFGIVASDYWTPAAKEMFTSCLAHVANGCNNDNDCPASTPVGQPFCQNGDVYQNVNSYTCEDSMVIPQCVPGQGPVLVEECDFGCANGQCIEPTCLNDSDCGTDGFVGGEFCSLSGDVVRNYKEFTCNNPGTANSYCSSNTEERLISTCVDTCANGQCIDVECNSNSDCNDGNPLTQDECINPGTPASDCRNTPINCNSNLDCGFTGFVGSEFCSVGDSVSKNFQNSTCVNGGTLGSHCQIETNPQVISQCQFACYNGACIACDSNSDCNDGNSATTDTCVNPGTLESFCRYESNEPITCYNNADCGTNGYVGGTYCSVSGDSVRDFKTWTCNSPGTTTSSCSSNVTQQVIEMCDNACVSGQCIDSDCDMDSDCNDSNPLTLDQCVNPGSSISECRNTPINCNSNLDCGFTGFLGQEYCSDDDVLKNYQNSTCVNAGTLNSYCDLEVEGKLLQQCGFACYNGACVACDSNSDCNDNNSNTVDLCNNPGTANSYCSNQPTVNGTIACTTSLDCGTTSVLSENFCSVNNVSQLVMTWDCNNPGLTTSYCSSSIEIQTLNSCPNYCSEGECVDIECFNHSDCDDDDSTTFDICINPGMPSSHCVNNPIEVVCYDDEDCGIDGPYGDEMCYDGDVTQLMIDYECLNPGTIYSICTSSLTQETVEMCDFMCVNGECVDEEPLCGNDELEDGEECDDGNLNNGDGCSSTCEVEEPTECNPEQTRQCGTTDVGLCSFGTETCNVNGEWGSCIGDVNPVTEICDTFDNDCDGQTDEGNVCTPVCTNQCTPGARMCAHEDGYRICVDENNDGCSEWSTNIISCGFGLECSGNGICN